MTERIPEAASWCLTAGLLAVSVLLLRQRGIGTRQRRRAEDLTEDLRARDEELRHLAEVRLPALEDVPHRSAVPSAPAAPLLDVRLAGTDFAKHLDGVLERFSEAVGHAQARADRSAKSALKASMRSIQALANEQQVSIAEMQDRHDDPDVLRDLLEIDHTNAQFGRRAQAIAVLCGSWPGRQRSTSALVEVVRGATSRVRDYRRVRVNGQVDLAVESRAVEPVVLAVAELLDNAARHSQPDTTVEVTVRPAHNGACVVVDDAGVGMDAGTVERAAGLLTGRDLVDVTRLDDPPQFGFAVIGVLAARYGFSVSVDTRSPYGGVRAVVFLPAKLLTHPVPAGGPGGARTASAPPVAPTRRAAEPVGTTTAGGLPKRRRRVPQQPDGDATAEQPASAAPTASAVSGAPTASAASAVPNASAASAAPTLPGDGVGPRSAEENARRMGAFARGTRFGRAEGDGGGTPAAPEPFAGPRPPVAPRPPAAPGPPDVLAASAALPPADGAVASPYVSPPAETGAPVPPYGTPRPIEGSTQG
ncbi:ATP-binding protein [Streptomyces sp. NPDC026665]|uniref:ATP-binding protein n=1 Tax=Streptomyces sp. NPDC026665 TaxID=3154798 RepID=UPI00340C52CF